jgi:hypothetical protein
MINSFFCAEMSRQVNEDPIGSATPCQTYVLVECPLPWTANAFESKGVPQNLRELVAAVKRVGCAVRFLLIHSESVSDRCRVLIYDCPAETFCQGYRCWEWSVDSIEQAAPLIYRYLSGGVPGYEAFNPAARDLLICVHGSHDKCCAKYGKPFYRQAIATLAELGYDHVRLWQVSHIGGHRFAPTLIDLPDGRYYGRLDENALRMILTRSGNVRSLSSVYRGWSILPPCLQPLERELILRCGWQWFNCKVGYQIVGQGINQQWVQAKFFVEHPDRLVDYYHGMVVKDDQKTVCIRNSCDQTQESAQVKYTVKLLRHLRSQLVCLQPCSDQQATILWISVWGAGCEVWLKQVKRLWVEVEVY